MGFFLVIVIAISLSMDAFSLSLAYGTLGIPQNQKYLLSLIVGLFHFFMPLLGMIIGFNVLTFLKVNINVVICIIFLIVGLEMIYESFNEKENFRLNKVTEYFLFAFAVSVDSFSVGFTLVSSNYLLSATTFALVSSFFTFLGLTLGFKIKKTIGKTSTVIGGIILIIIGIVSIL